MLIVALEICVSGFVAIYAIHKYNIKVKERVVPSMTKNTSDGDKKKDLSVFSQIRKKTNMSQEELARLFGVSFTTVNRWENGHAEPKFTLKQIHTLSILLRGMGIDMQDLPDSPFGKIQRLNLDQKEEKD